MVKIYKETVSEFTPWQGAVSTYDTIVEENKLDDLDFLLEDLFPEGISEGQLVDEMTSVLAIAHQKMNFM